MLFELNLPDYVTVFTESSEREFRAGETVAFDDVAVTFPMENKALSVALSADRTPVRYLRLRWNMPLPEDALFLGDAWERTYGDAQWRTHDPSRMMPWYFLMNHGTQTAGFGVKVRPGAFALWSGDPAGVTLWLDVRCGTKGVVLEKRSLDVAAVVSAQYDGISAFESAKRFCAVMCTDPLLPDFPVYGGNNWYYAYGKSSHEKILADCRYIASLCEGLENRPFMVIDDGWEVMHGKPGNSGPWTGGNHDYPDMARLAVEMRACGVRPGIWMRPLWNVDPAIPETWLFTDKNHSGRRYLDPSVPEVLEQVKADIRRIAGWGYELIKHDFSTFDIFGCWGREMFPWPASGDWAFSDRSRTSAEIVVSLYRAILEAADGALILGCNTIGHLGAGLMQLARIGDDTSGRRWDRTRKMGINALAFRLCQHRTFFDADADCIGVAGAIPWTLNRQWAELLAKSGTSFLASIRPGILSDSEFAEMKRYFALGSRQTSVAVPLDWMGNTTPAHWELDGGKRRFDWYEEPGGAPDFV